MGVGHPRTNNPQNQHTKWRADYWVSITGLSENRVCLNLLAYRHFLCSKNNVRFTSWLNHVKLLNPPWLRYPKWLKAKIPMNLPWISATSSSMAAPAFATAPAHPCPPLAAVPLAAPRQRRRRRAQSRPWGGRENWFDTDSFEHLSKWCFYGFQTIINGDSMMLHSDYDGG